MTRYKRTSYDRSVHFVFCACAACCIAIGLFAWSIFRSSGKKIAWIDSGKNIGFSSKGSNTPGVSNTYYVSAGGSASGDGSASHPWPSVNYALSQITPAGSTILLMPGIYTERIDVPSGGTRSDPLIIKSQTKWRACILGSSTYGIKTEKGADYVNFDGLEIAGSYNVGIYLNGNYNTVENCWIHNNSSQGIGAFGLTGTVLSSNLVEFNGQNVQFHHGIYAYGDSLTICNNIVRHNAALGIQLYPKLSHSRVFNNLVYDHHKTGILIQAPEGGGQNVIANNTCVDDKPAIGIYNGNGVVVVNNIFATSGSDPIFLDKQTSSTQVDYNLCYPKSANEGPHGLTGNPQFLDPAHFCFWLKTGSPAIGKGTTLDAPATDFWGNPLPASMAPDLGCFRYYKALTDPPARSNWYEGWPYRFRPASIEPGHDLPDLWKPPFR